MEESDRGMHLKERRHGGWRSAVNLALGKGETTGDKGRGQIRSEAVEVSVVVADAPTMDRLEKRYGTFGGSRM